ncbi:MAG: sulfocyanin-like copper-binding protein [Thermoplasmata archaeon]
MILVSGVAVTLVATEPARATASVVDASSGPVQVTADSGFLFTPNGISNVPTNSTITVMFTDADTIPHTFTIIDRQGVVIPTSTTDVSPLFDTYGALFTHNLSGSGDQYVGTFQSPASPGWYEFVCLEPGHFSSGMYGFIAFGEALPANISASSPDTGPGIAVFIIVGTIVSLVVIALVLGFVVGRRRGSTYEMPPQRLGYPEPEVPGATAPEPPLEPEEPRG